MGGLKPHPLERTMKRSIMSLSIAILLIAVGTAALSAPRISQQIRVTVKEIEPFSYCSVPHSGAFGDLSSVVNSLIGVMSRQNISPSGDLISVYHLTPSTGIPDIIDYEVGFPITPQAVPLNPLQRKEWSYPLMAVAEHRGPYEGLADVIDGMFDWIENNRYDQDGPVLGRFLVLPSDEVRPGDLRTEIWIPIKKQ